MAFPQPIFQVRGTQLKPYYSKGSSTYTTIRSSGNSDVALRSDATSGVFGGSEVDFRATANNRWVQYAGDLNWPSARGMSFLSRIVPQWTGNPAAPQNLVFAFGGGGAQGLYPSGLICTITTAGKIFFDVLTQFSGDIFGTTTAALSFTSGTPTSIVITWDGTSTVKVYQQTGAGAPSLIETLTLSGSWSGTWQQKDVSSITIGNSLGSGGVSTKCNYYLNEFCIFDSVVDGLDTPTSNFVPSSNLNGDTMPAAADVRLGTATGLNTGTAAIPVAANVRSGTATDATTGSLAVPAAASVLSGVSVDNTTGTYVAVATANVRSGTAYGAASALTGTAAIPVAANVRSGTATDATTGTLAVPAASNVLSGVSVDAGTGTYVPVAISNVRLGTTFGAASALTGTAAIPVAANVRSGTATDATTGTLAVPAASNVRSGTSVDNTTGTLAVPAASNVRLGTSVDAGTGTCVVPVAANVRLGTSVDATTGTLAVPSAADVRSGTATDATTGSLDIPATSNVKHGVVYDNSSKTGTYRGADLWESVTADQLAKDDEVLQNGVTVTGELDNVTNVLTSETLTAEDYSETLEATDD